MDVREQVVQLHQVYELAKRTNEKVHNLSIPVVTEYSDMRKMRDKMFKYAERWEGTSIGRRRRVFLYAMLHFVCPVACVGGRLPHGLRSKLSELLYDGVTRTIVSSDLGICCVYYRQYRLFREQVNELIEHIEEGLS